jgi:putative CocE/NonD family hydrolase
VSPDPRRYAPALWTLLGLFVLRVAGQLLIAIGYGDFLPPWEEWFSGLVPYSRLLVSQVVIIILFSKVCVDFTRRQGFFVAARSWLGTGLLGFGSVYLVVMVLRYVIRMSLYPPERWTGGSIPIFFHWVLASFVLVVGAYHRTATRSARHAQSVLRPRVVACWLAIALGISIWAAYQLAPALLASMIGARSAEYAVRIERDVVMMTRDGVRLAADVYHPVRAGRTPTILVRIPFSKTITNSLFATVVGRFWAERGYTVVIQGTRGRYRSDGRHYPLLNEREDGLDTLGWLERQPWFDGRLGMWGGSAFGHTQWAIADRLPSQPRGRSALMVQICSTDFHAMFYPGGAFSLSSALFWALRSRGPQDERPRPEALERGFDGLPLIRADDRAAADIGFFNDWVNHPTRDAYWRAVDGDDRTKTLQSPVLLMAGWFDPFLPGQLADFVDIRQHARADVSAGTRLIIGPWGHAETVRLPGGVQTRNYRLESLAPSIPWFDRHLRSLPPSRQRYGGQGAAPVQAAPVRLFVMGANLWRDEHEWPLARAGETAWYLRSGGHANSADGNGRLTPEAPAEDDTPDTFLADPSKPVPSRGGATLGYGAGVFPQNDIEMRKDVLVYSTATLSEDLEVTGPISVVLYVATSAPSADFTAKLVDVDPNGVAYNVSDGIVRQSYRPSSSPAATEPTRIDINLWPTSMVFRKGHRIRLEIAGSNFPRFDRNPQTGDSIATATTSVTATHAVYHGKATPSRIVLPIVPNTP